MTLSKKKKKERKKNGQKTKQTKQKDKNKNVNLEPNLCFLNQNNVHGDLGPGDCERVLAHGVSPDFSHGLKIPRVQYYYGYHG